jgi:hypothetical protein
MDYSLYFNSLSVPAPEVEKAHGLINDAFQGVLDLNQGTDRFFLFADTKNLDDFELAIGFTYGDFKTRLRDENSIDLLSFILEIEDKAPFIDYLSDERFEELSKMTIYMDDVPYNQNMDIFGQALLENGIMFSMATRDLWESHVINFFILRDGEYTPDVYSVPNISRHDHAQFILDKPEENIQEIFADVLFTEDFTNWYEACKREDKSKIRNIIANCHANDFQMGRPLIDTIRNSEFSNMKEIRAGNAHAQSGKIRILFAMDRVRRANILVGFIKHSNDYSDEIKKADSSFKTLNEGEQ